MEEKLANMRHTLAHLMAQAIIENYPTALLTLGPAIDNGFYYDVDFGDQKFTDEDLKKIQTAMRKNLKNWDEFTHEEVSADKAKEIFANNPYKLELINEIADKGEKITLYTCGGFTDLCRGGHSEHPNKEINADVFKLDRIAGAYWRGDEKNKMLTRIYGLAFETAEGLDEYLKMREEAEKRDHRKLGKELDLFTFSDLVGPGTPLFTPRGNIIRNEIISFSRELNKELGFDEVHTPNINKAELFKISGHYDKYKDDMLQVKSQYVKDEMFLKPMNCPQHTQIYASKMRSYRDLPIRYSDFAVLYRDERPGELSGLTRLRSFSQDDGHIFCREDQIEEEVGNILEAIKKALETYGIGYWMRLSLRDPNNKEKYLGSDEVWEKSESIMRKLLQDKKIDFKEVQGEAAFYGPKIDIMAVDALGREWQISTVQLDFNMPNRFELVYTTQDGTNKNPVMIHRALIGSPDRFLGILIEHFAGAFPVWLSPVQVAVLPVSNDAHGEYANEVYKNLKKSGVRSEILTEGSLSSRFRDVRKNKIPHMLIIGDKEIANKSITLQIRPNEKGQPSLDKIMKKEAYIEYVLDLIKSRSLEV